MRFMGRFMRRVYRKIRRLGGATEESQIERLEKKGLTIGKNNIIHSPDCFDSIYPWLIEIGDNNLFSTEVKILAHDSSTCCIDGITKVGRVSIGSNCYLGFRCTILCNTHIGDNVIIGAGSVVCSDCQSNSVYAGNPAKYICSLDSFKEKHKVLIADSPVFDQPWRYWRDQATESERNEMKKELEHTAGYVR